MLVSATCKVNDVPEKQTLCIGLFHSLNEPFHRCEQTGGSVTPHPAGGHNTEVNLPTRTAHTGRDLRTQTRRGRVIVGLAAWKAETCKAFACSACIVPQEMRPLLQERHYFAV